MYDTGDFIDDYYVGHEEKNDQQLLFLVMVSREKIKRVEMIPVEISKCQKQNGPAFLSHTRQSQ
ncbi:MAG: hypothetical protein WA130_13735 [Candidatus Methanoperedens sp.]